jgi:hypothetical protein
MGNKPTHGRRYHAQRRVRNSQPIVAVLSQMNPAHHQESYFFKISKGKAVITPFIIM